MVIKVDKWCIRHGVQESGHNCPVALAVRKVVRSGTHVNVASSWVEVKPSSNSSRYSFPALPINVQRFIAVFDEHGAWAVEPFTFSLRIPRSVVRP